MFFLKFLLSIVLIEAITELVVKTEIFGTFRKQMSKLGAFFHQVFRCGQCFSFWVSFGVVFLLQLSYNFTGIQAVDLILTVFIMHRLSNYLHNFNDKYLDKYYDQRFVNTERLED